MEDINHQHRFLEMFFGVRIAARLKDYAVKQYNAYAEGVDVRVLVSSPPPLPPRSIQFHFGEKTEGENMSIRVIFVVAQDLKMYSIHYWNPIESIASSEVLYSLDDTDPLDALADLVSKQESIGMAAILSWTQLEILASGEKIESGPRHPSLPSLPSSALREGVTASEAIRLPPSSISESLSQEEIANTDGLRSIAPNTPTSGDRYGELDQTLEDWRRRREQEKTAHSNRHDYMREDIYRIYEEADQEEKEIIVDILEEDTTPPSDHSPLAASPPADAIPSSPPLAPTQGDVSPPLEPTQKSSPLPDDTTQRGSPPPPAVPAAAAVAASTAASSPPAASASVSPPPRRSPRLNGTPPSPAAMGVVSPRRSGHVVRPSPPPPLPPASLPSPSTLGQASRKRPSSPAAASVSDDDEDEDAPAHSPRKAAKLNDILTRARTCMDELEATINSAPTISKVAKSVTSKIADYDLCRYWRSMAATMRNRYKRFLETSQIVVRCLNGQLLGNEERYDDIENFFDKYDKAKASSTEMNKILIQFSKKAHGAFEEYEDIVFDDESKYEGMSNLFKEKAAANLVALKEWHEAALGL